MFIPVRCKGSIRGNCVLELKKISKIAVFLDRYGPYQENILNEIKAILVPQGITVVSFFGFELNPNKLYTRVANQIYELAKQGDYQGLIIASSSINHAISADEFEHFAESFDFPVVSMGVRLANTASVTIDQQKGMRLLMEHLLSIGHKRFAFMRGFENNIDSDAREAVFHELLAEHGLRCEPELIVRGDFLTVDAYKAADELLEKRHDFDAWVCANDYMAFGVMQALAKHGLFVPTDVAVVGYDDLAEGQFTSPSLTTVRQPISELVSKTVELLQALCQGKESKYQLQVPSQLVIRQSCAIANLEAKTAQLDSWSLSLSESMRLCAAHYANTLKAKPELLACIQDFLTSLELSMQQASHDYLRVWRKMLVKDLKKRNDFVWWFAFIDKLNEMIADRLADAKLIRQSSAYVAELRSFLVQLQHAEQLKTQFIDTQMRSLQGRLHFSLSSAKNSEELYLRLAEFFDTHNIGACFMVLYAQNQQKQTVPEQAHLVFAYYQKRLAVKTKRFKTIDLLPQDMQVYLKNTHVLVEPLFVQDKSYGYLMIEAKLESTSMYEPLAHTLSIAIQNVLQLDALNKHSKQLEYVNKELAQLANYDALTGLPNRILFHERLRQSFVQADQQEKKVALLFFDLDGFKYINDSLGHSVGDQLLSLVSKRLNKLFRQSSSFLNDRQADFLSRLGGDEFAIVLSDLDDAVSAKRVAKAILQVFTEPFKIQNRLLYVTASIGISVYPDDSLDAEGLLKQADTAMYASKAAGKNQYQFFSQELQFEALQQLKLEQALRKGLSQNQFYVVYQPRLDFKTKEVLGFEALLRWQLKDELISPNTFIPLAERLGYIEALGTFVLEEACKQAKRWQDQGLNKTISVNLSAKQLQKEDIVQDIRLLLSKTGLDANKLELEVTESAAMMDVNANIEKLSCLRKMGVRIAIDDFGTAYSSLNYLKRLPVTSLKIDQSFVQDIDLALEDEQAYANIAIIKAIVALGKSLGFNLVAEGVETREQARVLEELGCHEVQGFLFFKPLSLPEVNQILGLLPQDLPVGSLALQVA